LIYKKFIKDVYNGRIVAENNRYIGQLRLYLSECQSIGDKLENTAYKEKSLANLFQRYYDCSSSDYSYKMKTEKIYAETGLIAGVSLSHMNFISSSKTFDYLSEGSYNSSISPTLGFSVELIMPKNQKKWSINNELIFTYFKFKGTHFQSNGEDNNVRTNFELAYAYLKMNNLIRYKYPIGKSQMFFNAGVSNGIVISEKNEKREGHWFYSSYKVTNGSAIDETRKYEIGLVLGAGLKKNKLSFEMRYEKGNGITDYASLKASPNRYYFLIGYQL